MLSLYMYDHLKEMKNGLRVVPWVTLSTMRFKIDTNKTTILKQTYLHRSSLSLCMPASDRDENRVSCGNITTTGFTIDSNENNTLEANLSALLS